MAKRYYGVYVGTVVDNNEPSRNNKVKVRIEGFGGEDDSLLPWARVAASGVGYGQGSQPLPKVGVDVVVAFEQGRPENPLVLTELLTELDKPNAPKRTYTAGPVEEIAEGTRDNYAARNQRVRAGRSVLLEAVGNITLRARQLNERINGLRSIIAKREEVDIQGGSSRQVRGVAELKFLSDLTQVVVGKLNLSAAQGMDLFVVGVPLIKDLNITAMLTNFVVNAITPGVIWLRQRSPIPDPTGLLDLATVKTDPIGNVYVLSNTGFIRVGRVATQGLAGTPVTLAAHTHLAVGNLGLPIVTAPTVPVPLNISTSLLVE